MTKMNHPLNSKNHDDVQARLISSMIAPAITKLLDKFNVQYTFANYYYYGTCPLHEGADNISAWKLYTQSAKYGDGTFSCYTKNCQKRFGNHLVGFTRGLFAQQKKVFISHKEAVEYLCELYGINKDTLTVTNEVIDKFKFIQRYSQLKDSEKHQKLSNRPYIRSRLNIPAQFYIKRGISVDTLDSYDIGTPKYEKITRDGTLIDNPLFGRVIAPIYDENYEYTIGYTSRCSDEVITFPKWLHSGTVKSTFFNFWKIRQFKTIIMVEGVSDVLRLCDTGIPNAVACFGNSINDEQLIKLECLPIERVVVAPHNDDSGKLMVDDITRKLKRLFKISVVSTPAEYKDVGEMPSNKLFPLFKEFCK